MYEQADFTIKLLDQQSHLFYNQTGGKFRKLDNECRHGFRAFGVVTIKFFATQVSARHQGLASHLSQIIPLTSVFHLLIEGNRIALQVCVETQPLVQLDAQSRRGFV